MTASGLKQLFTQLVRIGEIAVMRQRNTVRGVNVKRLRFRGAGAASGRVTHVADTDIALQTLHVARFKHVADQAICFAQTEAVQRIDSTNAGGILSAVLQHR